MPKTRNSIFYSRKSNNVIFNLYIYKYIDQKLFDYFMIYRLSSLNFPPRSNNVSEIQEEPVYSFEFIKKNFLELFISVFHTIC